MDFISKIRILQIKDKMLQRCSTRNHNTPHAHNEAICKGCGTCMVTCPKKAIFVWHFRPEQLLAEVKAALGVEV